MRMVAAWRQNSRSERPSGTRRETQYSWSKEECAELAKGRENSLERPSNRLGQQRSALSLWTVKHRKELQIVEPARRISAISAIGFKWWGYLFGSLARCCPGSQSRSRVASREHTAGQIYSWS